MAFLKSTSGGKQKSKISFFNQKMTTCYSHILVFHFRFDVGQCARYGLHPVWLTPA